MEFELHTYDLQDIVIALICNDSAVLAANPDQKQKLIDLFSGLNQRTNEANNWTLKFTVTD